MDLSAAAREVGESFRAAIQHHEAGNLAAANDSIARGSMLLERALDEVDWLLAELRSKLRTKPPPADTGPG